MFFSYYLIIGCLFFLQQIFQPTDTLLKYSDILLKSYQMYYMTFSVWKNIYIKWFYKRTPDSE